MLYQQDMQSVIQGEALEDIGQCYVRMLISLVLSLLQRFL